MVGNLPGPVLLFGSGEISPGAQSVYDALLRQMGSPCTVAVLETPAGFEPNSARVAGRVADYIRLHLRNHAPQVTVIPARKRGTPFSPDEPEVVAPLFQARTVFLGPGSPTYAVRQLRGSLAWQIVLARQRLGAALVLASAATIAASRQALPIYEIFKAGHDLHWIEGLDIFAPYGLPLVLVPHWNNNDGGAELDTSRCFMGRSRFAELLSMLPAGSCVVGIDEHTGALFDLAHGACQVISGGGVTILAPGGEKRHAAGETFPLTEFGPYRIPSPYAPPVDVVPDDVWQAALDARGAEPGGDQAPEPLEPEPPALVQALVAERQQARSRRDWPAADALRKRIAELGWQVSDTPAGPVVGRSELPGKRDDPIV